MVRSTVEPDEIEIQEKRVTNEGLKIDLLVHWDINRTQVEDMDGTTHTEYKYEEEEYTVTVDDNRKGAEDYIKNSARMIKLKGKMKAEARTGKNIMTDLEKSDLRGNRPNIRKGSSIRQE